MFEPKKEFHLSFLYAREMINNHWSSTWGLSQTTQPSQSTFSQVLWTWIHALINLIKTLSSYFLILCSEPVRFRLNNHYLNLFYLSLYFNHILVTFPTTLKDYTRIYLGYTACDWVLCPLVCVYPCISQFINLNRMKNAHQSRIRRALVINQRTSVLTHRYIVDLWRP